MVTFSLSNEQVVDLVKQLPQEGKQAVLDALSSEQDLWWDLTLSQGDEQLRQLCVERGLDWDKLTEEERETFIDDLFTTKSHHCHCFIVTTQPG